MAQENPAAAEIVRNRMMVIRDYLQNVVDTYDEPKSYSEVFRPPLENVIGQLMAVESLLELTTEVMKKCHYDIGDD